MEPVELQVKTEVTRIIEFSSFWKWSSLCTSEYVDDGQQHAGWLCNRIILSEDYEYTDAAADEHIGVDVAFEQVSVTTVAIPIEQRISKLPKNATPALYESLLASMSGDVDMLKSVTEAVIENLARRHRGTAPQRAFLTWLEEHNTHQPE